MVVVVVVLRRDMNSSFSLQMTFVSPLSGREQAELTGQRLASLGLKYDVLIHSSMTRATETAQIISKYLPGDGLPSTLHGLG